MDLTTATPAEIDAAWEPLARDEANYTDREQRFRNLADEATREDARAEYRAYADEFQSKADAATNALAPLRAEWSRRGGWTRV